MLNVLMRVGNSQIIKFNNYILIGCKLNIQIGKRILIEGGSS